MDSLRIQTDHPALLFPVLLSTGPSFEIFLPRMLCPSYSWNGSTVEIPFPETWRRTSSFKFFLGVYLVFRIFFRPVETPSGYWGQRICCLMFINHSSCQVCLSKQFLSPVGKASFRSIWCSWVLFPYINNGEIMIVVIRIMVLVSGTW